MYVKRFKKFDLYLLKTFLISNVYCGNGQFHFIKLLLTLFSVCTRAGVSNMQVERAYPGAKLPLQPSRSAHCPGVCQRNRIPPVAIVPREVRLRGVPCPLRKLNPLRKQLI